MESKYKSVERLVLALYGLGEVRRTLARRAFAELGSQGFGALAAVHRRGSARVSEVAADLGVDLSVASRQLQALGAAGYLERAVDADDARARRVSVTGAGREALSESHRRLVESFSAVLDGWSADDVAALAQALGRLSADFADHGHVHAEPAAGAVAAR